MAMNTPISSSDAVLSAILQPHTNYAARSAARQEAVQLQGYLTAQEEKKASEAQQADANTQQYLQTLKSVQFMGRDQQKLAGHVRGEERAVYQRIRDDYGGNFKQWYAAEYPSWVQQATARLTQSPMYQQATQNRQNVMTAQEARQKGERLVGSAVGGKYQTGEQQLQDFLQGRSDAYVNSGSYKPEDDLKELRSTNAPGRMPWEQVAVSEEDKLAHLINQYGEQVGVDKYQRQHKNIATFYRTEPLTKKIDFINDQQRMQMELGRYGMAQEDQSMQRQLFGLQKEGLRLSNKKKKAELNGGGSEKKVPYDHYLLSSPSEIIPLKHDPASPKRLSNGVDLGKINKLSGVTLYGQGDDILARHLGLQRTRDGYRGHFDSAFSTENGVNAINLKGVNYEILGVDSKAFYNPADMGPNADPHGHLQGFARVTLRLSPYAAEAAGLYNPNRMPFVDKDKPTSLFDSETKIGSGGVYNPQSGTATLYVPAGNLRNPNFVKALQRDEKGTKSANEEFNAPYLNTGL